MARQISEITRRDLWEALAGVSWWGRLDEIEFLKRLFPLKKLPSTDSRYSDAEGDIIQHRVANNDWESDWVFSDDRFELSNGDDQKLLRFLCEMLHPAVRKEAEAERLAVTINGLLRADGYQLVRKGAVSGRPVYGWEKVDPAVVNPDAHFTKSIAPLMVTLSELAQHGGSELEQEVLKSARAKLEQPEHDNWDGGTYYYTLTLVVPVAVFARLGEEVNGLEQQLVKRIDQILRGPDHHRITAVVIQPGQVATSELAKVVAARSDRLVPQFWTRDQFRLFLSHVTSFKTRTAALRQVLSKYHISAFVAHDTIDAGELWQREIEAALNTMDAMVALLTPDFHESQWTDQEIGWALGRGVYALPVRKGLNPYGFIAEVQGIQGQDKMLSTVADEIFSVLVRHPKTREKLQEAIVKGFEGSSSGPEAVANLNLVERGGSLPPGLSRRVESAPERNRHIAAIASRVRHVSAGRA